MPMSEPAIPASSDIEITPDYEAVIEAIERHDPYIFVSGKAGTGKTTLIGYLRETIPGNVVVVAPTGVAALQVKYPQGSEKQLIKAIIKREVPKGGLPMDVGVIVHNVGTIFAIYQAVQYDQPLIERVVTVTGKKIETIKYTSNYFTLLNVMEPHGVLNSNNDKERIILSMGFKNNSYDDLVKKFKDGLLINDIL